jgi:hypothetical protein
MSGPSAMSFNWALFQKQGLKTPDQYEREGNWPFDTYLDLSRKRTTGTAENTAAQTMAKLKPQITALLRQK